MKEFFAGLLRREPEPDTEQALIVRWQLPSEYCDVADVQTLEDALSRALAEAGEVDGHESGNHELTIYIYGADADELWSASEPILTDSAFGRGQATLRYGSARDATAREVVREIG